MRHERSTHAESFTQVLPESILLPKFWGAQTPTNDSLPDVWLDSLAVAFFFDASIADERGIAELRL
jgi:hypothetical protein